MANLSAPTSRSNAEAEVSAAPVSGLTPKAEANLKTVYALTIMPEDRRVSAMELYEAIKDDPEAVAVKESLERLGQYGTHYANEDFDILSRAYARAGKGPMEDVVSPVTASIQTALRPASEASGTMTVKRYGQDRVEAEEMKRDIEQAALDNVVAQDARREAILAGTVPKVEFMATVFTGKTTPFKEEIKDLAAGTGLKAQWEGPSFSWVVPPVLPERSEDAQNLIARCRKANIRVEHIGGPQVEAVALLPLRAALAEGTDLEVLKAQAEAHGLAMVSLPRTGAIPAEANFLGIVPTDDKTAIYLMAKRSTPAAPVAVPVPEGPDLASLAALEDEVDTEEVPVPTPIFVIPADPMRANFKELEARMALDGFVRDPDDSEDKDGEPIAEFQREYEGFGTPDEPVVRIEAITFDGNDDAMDFYAGVYQRAEDGAITRTASIAAGTLEEVLDKLGADFRNAPRQKLFLDEINERGGLSELMRPVKDALAALSPDGNLPVLEPADLEGVARKIEVVTFLREKPMDPYLKATDLEANAMADYQDYLGKVVTVDRLQCYLHDDSKDLDCGGVPFVVRVTPTQDEDIKHWNDEYLDPYWNVEVVEPHPALPEGFTSPWIDGPTYELFLGSATVVAVEATPKMLITGKTFEAKEDFRALNTPGEPPVAKWDNAAKGWLLEPAEGELAARIRKLCDLLLSKGAKVDFLTEVAPKAAVEPEAPAKDTRKNGFRGEHAFLSNFHLADLAVGGHTFHSLEAAFQAAKCADPEDQSIFADLSPNAAKKLGRKIELRPDWEEVKLGVMKDLLAIKFQDPELQAQLLATGDLELVEANTWGDVFYGEVNGKGENHLGRLLMDLRENLRNPPPAVSEPEVAMTNDRPETRTAREALEAFYEAVSESGSWAENRPLRQAAITARLEMAKLDGTPEDVTFWANYLQESARDFDDEVDGEAATEGLS